VTTLSAVVRWLLVFFYPQNLGVLFFAQSLHALSFALFYSAAIMYLHQLYDNKVLAQQFFSGLTFGLGGFVGALSFGYIYELNAEYLFLVAAFVAMAAFLSIYLWSRTLVVDNKVKS
jgi:PPP family 3-phenylpropionic acid transporter